LHILRGAPDRYRKLKYRFTDEFLAILSNIEQFYIKIMSYVYNHKTDGISRVRETSRNQSTLIQISTRGFAAKNKKVLIFIKSVGAMHSKLLIFYNKSIEFIISNIF
jgi:hypothetical protein